MSSFTLLFAGLLLNAAPADAKQPAGKAKLRELRRAAERQHDLVGADLPRGL